WPAAAWSPCRSTAPGASALPATGRADRAGRLPGRRRVRRAAAMPADGTRPDRAISVAIAQRQRHVARRAPRALVVEADLVVELLVEQIIDVELRRQAFVEAIARHQVDQRIGTLFDPFVAVGT